MGQVTVNQYTTAFHTFMAQIRRPLRLATTDEIVYRVGKTSSRFASLMFRGPKDLAINMEHNHRPISIYQVKILVATSEHNVSSSEGCRSVYKNSNQSICPLVEKIDYKQTKSKTAPICPISQAPISNKNQHTLRSIHNFLTYNRLGENIQTLGDHQIKHLAPERLAPYVNLLPRATETPKPKIETADELGIRPDFDFQAYMSDNLPSAEKNLTIIPVDDGVAVGFSAESNLVSTFLLDGFHNVRKRRGNNLIFLINGTKAINTGEGDDTIFVDKVNELEGFVDAKKGDDTLVIVDKKTHTLIESEVGPILTISGSNGEAGMTLMNVEHVVGRREIAETLHLLCGLNSVNLGGGRQNMRDLINVDVSQCPDDPTIVMIEQHTNVIHLAGSDNLRYKFIEGPALITNNQQTAPNDKSTVSVVEILFELMEMSKLTILPGHEHSFNISMEFGAHMHNTRLINIDNFDSSFKVVFQDIYQMFVKDGQFYIHTECNENPSNIDPDFLKLLHKQGVIFVKKCTEQSTLVYTGITVKDNHGNGILPSEYVYLQNDVDAETHFKIQYDPLPHVYHLDGTCRPSDQLQLCQEIKVDVDASGETFFDLRDATRGFEDDGCVVEVTFKTYFDAQHNKREHVRVYAKKPDTNHKYVLANINLHDLKTPERFPVTILTSRHRIELLSDYEQHVSYLAKKNVNHLIVVDNAAQEKVAPIGTSAESRSEHRHGDVAFYDYVSLTNSEKISAIFLNVTMPMCQA